jgi:hypothetical protein
MTSAETADFTLDAVVKDAVVKDAVVKDAVVKDAVVKDAVVKDEAGQTVSITHGLYQLRAHGR